MKKLLVMLSAVMLFAGGYCKAESLIDYVPTDADGVISVDAKRLINLSQVKDLRKENKEFNENWQKLESELKKYGLKTSDLPSKMMMFFSADVNEKKGGILAITKITEAKLVDLFKASKDKIEYAEKTIAGRKAYVVSQKGESIGKAAVTYLKPGLILICDEDKAEHFFNAVGKSKNEKLIAADKKADHKALAYILYSKAVKAAPEADDGANPMAVNPFDNIESAVVALDLTGKNNSGVSLNADLNCANANAATQITMQLKTFVMIMGMQMAQKPELGKAITEAVAIDQKDKNIKVKISLSESLITQLKTAVKEKQEQALARKAAPNAAPAGK